MKSPQTTSVAFTLVELLTVIAIIAILMGLLFPVIGSVKDKARGVEAQNMLKQLTSAITQYNSEYGRYPSDETAQDVFLKGNDGPSATLLRVIRAYPATDADVKALNPRTISYIDLSLAKIPDPATKAYSGLDSTGYLHDPWGYHRMILDTNYDNLVASPYAQAGGAGGTETLTKGVIAWSLGKDGKGASGGTPAQGQKNSGDFADDILSW